MKIQDLCVCACLADKCIGEGMNITIHTHESLSAIDKTLAHVCARIKKTAKKAMIRSVSSRKT